MVAASGGATLGAVFHVAQLVWLAGLVVPAAIRSALLPVLGRARDDPVHHRRELNHAFDMCFALLPYGLFGGYVVVNLLAPLAFPAAYLDGTHGASAIDVFTVLLAGWGLTLVATPTYASLMAGHRPWRFTLFILFVLLAAVVLGAMLVLNGPEENGAKLYAAATASSLSAGVLLLLSWWMSGHVRVYKLGKTSGRWSSSAGVSSWLGWCPRPSGGCWAPAVPLHETRLESNSRHASVTDSLEAKSSRSSTVSSSAQPVRKACSIPSAKASVKPRTPTPRASSVRPLQR